MEARADVKPSKCYIIKENLPPTFRFYQQLLSGWCSSPLSQWVEYNEVMLKMTRDFGSVNNHEHEEG